MKGCQRVLPSAAVAKSAHCAPATCMYVQPALRGLDFGRWCTRFHRHWHELLRIKYGLYCYAWPQLEVFCSTSNCLDPAPLPDVPFFNIRWKMEDILTYLPATTIIIDILRSGPFIPISLAKSLTR
ncbi:hypothetical protein DFH09DRAFT_1269358 [Mycena vulgaris]|nr:hypothetical protein DFH09DRAFT_1269358 [Mycena vulgaris]